MQMETLQESTTLRYRQGGSDKIYQVAIEPAGTGFVVNFAFGRRGSTLQTGSKTPRPVSHEDATRVFNKLVREKTAKGYSPAEDGTPYTQTSNESRFTGILPQLLNPMEEANVDRLIANDAWWMQEKLDGRRVLIQKRGETIIGINRSGLTIALPEPIAVAVAMIAAESCLLDGEAVGDVYHAFDLMEQDGTDLRKQPYALRYDSALDLVDAVPVDELRFVTTATTTMAKRAMLERFRQEHKEGVVFKQHCAPYTPGRPAAGGNQLKLKFYATASCVVSAVSARKRSVALHVVRNAQRVPVGNVTIPPNHPLPRSGDVVEVRYLYAYPGGSLYQPLYLCRRDDVDAAECVADQLKFKAGDGDDEGMHP